jgi:aminoglycoside 2'-N-acetyltransferase I
MLIEVRGGPESRPEVQSLFAQVYPDAVLETVPWRNVTSAPADHRVVLLDDAGNIVASAGLISRTASLDNAPVRIGGIGGVMVSPAHQRQGLGRIVMEAVHECLRSDHGVQFGLLFCEPHNTGFYESVGWRRFEGEVFAEQPNGSVRYDIMPTMTLSVATNAPRSGRMDLRGLPW